MAVALAGGLVAGVSWIGKRAGHDLAEHQRYSVPTSDIRFDPPPHTPATLFLTEVRYLTGLPESVQTVDPDLPQRLSDAFARHPWVERVKGVTVTPDGQIHVNILYRSPVLAVRWRNGSEREVLAVDASAVLLPANAPTDRLPVLVNERTGPKPDAGRMWLDPDVRRAAELAARAPTQLIERTKTGWAITEADGKKYVILAP